MATRLVYSAACRARPMACGKVAATSSALIRQTSPQLRPLAMANRALLSTSSGKVPNNPPSASENGNDGGEGRKQGRWAGFGEGRGPLTWGAVGLATVGGILLIAYYRTEKGKRQSRVTSQIKTTGKPLLGGPFTLVDMHGRPVTDKDFLGSFVMLYFGFCRCPDICPSELVKIGAITKKLADKLGDGVVKPVFISVDPDRDSLDQLRHYAKDFHPSIQYLTGTKAQVEKAAKAYRVYFSKTEEHDENEPYLVDHSIVIYLLAPNGEFLDFFTQRTTIADCVERSLKEIKNFRAQSA